VTLVDQIRSDRMRGLLTYGDALDALVRAGCTEPVAILGPVCIGRSPLLGARGVMRDQGHDATRLDLRRVQP
jgi:hypothetical protein